MQEFTFPRNRIMMVQRKAFLCVFFSYIPYVFTNITYPAFEPGCGLIEGKDTWEVTGTVNVTDTAYFNPEISLKTTAGQVSFSS